MHIFPSCFLAACICLCIPCISPSPGCFPLSSVSDLHPSDLQLAYPMHTGHMFLFLPLFAYVYFPIFFFPLFVWSPDYFCLSGMYCICSPPMFYRISCTFLYSFSGFLLFFACVSSSIPPPITMSFPLFLVLLSSFFRCISSFSCFVAFLLPPLQSYSCFICPSYKSSYFCFCFLFYVC